MSWIPPDLALSCQANTTVSTCQPQAFMFLGLVTGLFGYSLDNRPPRTCSPDETFVDESKKEEDYSSAEYDFIIVGAGSAGCVVANRLSEVKGWRILLLEAGIEEPLVADVPGLVGLLPGSNIDWGYKTEPQKFSCRAQEGQSCGLPRGKVMGGCSSHNEMVYIRGNAEDYNEWARLGNYGWEYEKVLPYFRKSENNGDPEIVENSPHYHSTGGYLDVQRFHFLDKNIPVLAKAFEDMGYPATDVNAENQIGVMNAQTTSYRGSRRSSNGAFIRPIRHKRANLVVKTQAQVTRIIIDPDTKRATGVEYLCGKTGLITVANASKEVILSAGVINSPKILMLSGVGPAEDLSKIGIPVIQDLAVGHNLHDHVMTDGIIIEMTNKTAYIADYEKIVADIYQYKETQTGPLAAEGPGTFVAFGQTRYENSERIPDVEYIFNSSPLTTGPPNIYPSAYYNAIHILPIILTPKSRGFVKLNETDPIGSPPLIDPKHFDVEQDLDGLLAGVEIALGLFNTETFRENGYRINDEPLPRCKDLTFATKAYWKCVAMEYTAAAGHLVGTCKMGPMEDRQAVVDPELRVNGIASLRVVDASVMPIVPRGNTNAPTMMIGEKASDLIKSQWLEC